MGNILHKSVHRLSMLMSPDTKRELKKTCKTNVLLYVSVEHAYRWSPFFWDKTPCTACCPHWRTVQEVWTIPEKEGPKLFRTHYVMSQRA
jgi:hypothetical protein